LKQALSKLCGIPAEAIVLCDVFNNKFYRQMKDNENVEDIGDNDVIHGYDNFLLWIKFVLDFLIWSRVSYEIMLPKSEEEKDGIVYVPVYWRRDDRSMKTMFGVPFIMSLPSNITYRELYKIVAEQYIARFMKQPLPTDFPKPEPKEEQVEAEQTEAAAISESKAEQPAHETEQMDVTETRAEATADIQAR